MKRRTVIWLIACVVAACLMEMVILHAEGSSDITKETGRALYKFEEVFGQEKKPPVPEENNKDTASDEDVPSIIYDEEKDEYRFNKDVLKTKTYLSMDAIKAYEMTDVPEDILPVIRTDNLLDIVLDTPVCQDVIFFWVEEQKDALDIIRSKSNAMDELLEREDVATVTLEKYRDYPIDDTDEHWYSIFVLESILGYPSVYEDFSEEQIEFLDSLIDEIGEEKLQYDALKRHVNRLREIIDANIYGIMPWDTPED